MVIPGTRHMIVAALMNYFKRGIASGNIHVFTNFRSSSNFRHVRQDSNTFEAEYEKKD
jgi:hypothetical protein